MEEYAALTIAMRSVRYFDRIGGYWYEYGYCVRDAFAQWFGAGHPWIAELPRSAAHGDVVAWCARHGMTLYHVEVAVWITVGTPAVWLLRGAGDYGHAVYTDDPQRIVDSGRDVIGIAVLSPVGDELTACSTT